jgi:hypothetical protein
LKILPEKINGPIPCKLSGSLVIPRGCIIVKAMVYIRVDVSRIHLVIFFQRSLIGRPALIDPFIRPGKVQQQGGLDVGYLLIRRGSSDGTWIFLR